MIEINGREEIVHNGTRLIIDDCPHCGESILFDPTKDFNCPHCGSSFWGEPKYWEQG